MDFEEIQQARYLNSPFININRVHFYLIGCGGTGSKLMPELCQAITLFNENILGFLQASLDICDPDRVEIGNLNRQHFVAADLGKNKARVLAQRYSAAYGLNIGCRETLINEPEDLGQFMSVTPGFLIPQHQALFIIITAVDNHPTRRIVHQFLTKTIRRLDSEYYCNQPIFWIDLGNEEINGYVNIGFIHNNVNIPPNIFLPMATEVFPEILEKSAGIKPSELGCGAGGLQDLNINAASATHCMSVIRMLLKKISASEEQRFGGNQHNFNDVLNYYQVEFGVKPPTAIVKYNVPRNLEHITPAHTERYFI